jgi:hypothetical protein
MEIECFKIQEKLGETEINLNIGDKVKVINFSKHIAMWGNNDYPSKLLSPDEIYTVSHIEPHSWHTKIYLREVPKKKFNSGHFIKVEK